jgi:replicative DNA helicase
MKQLPYTLEAERGVLGSALLDPQIISNISLSTDDFFERRHQILWGSLVEQYAEGKAMDAITIGKYLNDTNKLNAVGGYDYLVELQDATVISSHSQHYARLVKTDSELRSEIKILEDGLSAAYGRESASDTVISSLIGNSIAQDEELSMDVLAETFIDECDRGQVGHFPWWCNEWTKHLGNMSSDLMIFHAPRSTGKTAMMLQWIVSAHLQGKRTPLASIEMLKKELAPRFIANIGQVSTFTMRIRGHITESEKARSGDAVKKIKALHLCIKDKAMTIDDIRAWSVSEYRNGADAIFIDNLLSISEGNKTYQSKTIMYDDFIRKLRDLRDLLKIPIIILAHPNSEGQVAWSRDVENFADVILFMHEVPPQGIEQYGVMVNQRQDISGKHILAIFQKNRQGISPMASLEFQGDTQTFTHLSWEK